MRESIHWWWVGLVERMLDLPYVFVDARGRAAARLQHTHLVLADALLELQYAVGSRLPRHLSSNRDEGMVAWAERLEVREAEHSERENAVAAVEDRLELHSAQLEALEQSLSERGRRLGEREADLELRFRELELGLDREDELTDDGPPGAEDRADLEMEWWQKQLGSATGGTSHRVVHARPRFDPAMASALRRRRHERRLVD